MKSKDNRIKLMFLAIQKDNFEQFQTYFEECSKDSDVNNGLRNTSEDSAVHVAAQHGRMSILRWALSMETTMFVHNMIKSVYPYQIELCRDLYYFVWNVSFV